MCHPLTVSSKYGTFVPTSNFANSSAVEDAWARTRSHPVLVSEISTYGKSGVEAEPEAAGEADGLGVTFGVGDGFGVGDAVDVEFSVDGSVSSAGVSSTFFGAGAALGAAGAGGASDTISNS